MDLEESRLQNHNVLKAPDRRKLLASQAEATIPCPADALQIWWVGRLIRF